MREIGQRVGWTLKSGDAGTGRIVAPAISMDPAVPHWLVAVDLPAPWFCREDTAEYHPVIYCAETWLHDLEATP